MKKKIFFYYVALIVAGAGITGLLTSIQAQGLYRHEIEEKLKSSAALIKYNMLGDVSQGVRICYDDAAKTYAELLSRREGTGVRGRTGTATRVTFIDFEGNVLGESDTDAGAMENHLERKEVREALGGLTGSDVRLSRTMQIEYLYIAMPVEQLRVIVRLAVPLSQLKKINETILRFTLLGIFAGFLLTAFLAYNFSNAITIPIKHLISAASQISMGNYAKRLDVKSNDELGILSQTFNEMAEKLEKTVGELTDKNLKFDSVMNSLTDAIIAVDADFKIIMINGVACKLFGLDGRSASIGSKFTEAVRNNSLNSFLKETIESGVSLADEISMGPPENKILKVYANPIKAKDARGSNIGGILFLQDITSIKKLEQIRTDFVSNVTHELKTPLTSIKGFIETLKNGAISDMKVAGKFLDIIDIEADRLYMLINDVLQLSEIETRQNDSNVEAHCLKGIIAEVVSILQGAAEKKNIVVGFEADENLTIVANKDRIKQMLINLIDNAIKYNIEGGSVYIKAFRGEGKIVISVKDTGIGIAPEHLTRIFERFYRVDKGRSRSVGGTGLGLSIVKHIVNLYSGDIKVMSEPGKGTEFVVQLPSA